MKVLYSDQPPHDGSGKSLFLVGPTPRSDAVPSWRPTALEIIEKLGFDGTVLVPERRDWRTKFGYVDQVEWEYQCLACCSRILAWVPRCMQTMPALTTNVEFGYWLARCPEKLFYGRPDGAPHTGYLDWFYNKLTNRQPFSTLEDMLTESVKSLNNG
jgi:hypothetical protein